MPVTEQKELEVVVRLAGGAVDKAENRMPFGRESPQKSAIEREPAQCDLTAKNHVELVTASSETSHASLLGVQRADVSSSPSGPGQAAALRVPPPGVPGHHCEARLPD